jgi:hypothetical protein
MSTFRSSALRLMPPQYHERVGKWTHEPQANLNHKKHIFNAFTHSFIFSQHHFIPKIEKYIHSLAHTTKTQKHHYHIIFILLHCYLLYRTAYHILILLTFTPCAWQPQDTKRLFCRLLEEERAEIFWLFPESSILNPEFPRGENLLLLQHSALEVPTSWHLCLVSSAYIKSSTRTWVHQEGAHAAKELGHVEGPT